ncbi:MAG: hypothetical protein HYT37_02875 [Candidatus Sungbacteria bacterium]|nr:hypothetical protein [Candidatus Sungbacteria bacterium]
MPHKKHPTTTVTPAQKRRATIVHKDLTEFLTLFHITDTKKWKQELIPSNVAALLAMRERILISMIANVIPLSGRVSFLNEAEKILFKNHKSWLKEYIPLLHAEFKDKF